MRVEDLHNYGTNMHDLSMNFPKDVAKHAQKRMNSVIIKEIGILKALKLRKLIRKKTKEYSKINLERIRSFCKNEAFIQAKISDAATYAAIRDLTSADEVDELYKKIMNEIVPILEDSMYPNPKLMDNFENRFETIKKYILSIMEADQQDGLHIIEVVEDTEDGLQFNVMKCAWFETKKELGIPEATFQDCYGDEVSLPGLLEKVGVKFSRTQTIASGAKFCDFRFVRIR